MVRGNGESMRLVVFCLITLLSAAACTEWPNLNGTWGWSCGYPSGAFTNLTLTASAGTVVGNGTDCALGNLCYPLTIAGQQSWNTFSLTLRDSSGVYATYSGSLDGDQLAGTWSQGATSVSVTMTRE